MADLESVPDIEIDLCFSFQSSECGWSRNAVELDTARRRKWKMSSSMFLHKKKKCND